MSVAASSTAASVFDAMTCARLGLERGLARAASAAQSIAGAGAAPADLSRAVVDSIVAVRQLEASATVLGRLDRVLGTLLDVRA